MPSKTRPRRLVESERAGTIGEDEHEALSGAVAKAVARLEPLIALVVATGAGNECRDHPS